MTTPRPTVKLDPAMEKVVGMIQQAHPDVIKSVSDAVRWALLEWYRTHNVPATEPEKE